MTNRQQQSEICTCASAGNNTTSSTTTSTTNSTSRTSSIREHHYQNHDYDNDNYNIHPEPGVCISPEDGERLREAYEENLNMPITGAVAQMIENAVSHGLTVDEVILAMEETAFAPKPTPWYLRAILQNWVLTGVTVSKARHEVHANRGIRWWKGTMKE